jgi:photosystem II stability/assembly factor-like uncharacterized protein
VDPLNHEIIYAGTSNGLWKSVNAGESWIQKSKFPVRSIVIDPKDSSRMILASDIGIWKSSDGADTLAPANSGFVNHTVGAFLDLGDSIMASAVYEVGSGTVFDTRDGGQEWTARSGDSLFGEHIFHFAQSSGAVFAAGDEHLFRSNDDGKTWIRLPLTANARVTGLEAVPRAQTLLVTTISTVYASKDLGTQWRQLSLPKGVSRIEKCEVFRGRSDMGCSLGWYRLP